MHELGKIRAALTRLVERSRSGFAIGLHLEYASPRYLFQTYPKSWSEVYSARGYLLYDPAVLWGLSETGSIAWSELSDRDDTGVLAHAAQFGMVFGVTISKDFGELRSLGSFARPDREFTDLEIKELDKELTSLHRLTHPSRGIDPSELSDIQEYLLGISNQNPAGDVAR